jgi:predicted NBD/HSP70 family sugar kinase
MINGQLERDTAADASARAVALAVLRFGPLSRAELARRLGLSTASLTRLTRPMIDRGLLIEQAASPSRAGRPSLPLEIATDWARFIGIKITVDTIYAVVCDLGGGVLDRRERPVDSPEVSAVTAILVEMAEELRAEHKGVAAVGIALGGTVLDHRLVREVTLLGWEDVDLADQLQTRLELPISVDNDVRALTQAEHWFGAGRGCSSLVVITVGLGVGCGIIVHDQLLHGAHGPSARIDHWPLDPDGPRCHRGHHGCADATLTTGAISSQASERLGRPVSLEQCIGLAAAGDPTAISIIEHAADLLGLLVARVADVIGPERILLTGDGLDFVRQAEPVMRSSFARQRSHLATGDDLRIGGSDFYDWARGAAAVAIRDYVIDELEVT